MDSALPSASPEGHRTGGPPSGAPPGSPPLGGRSRKSASPTSTKLATTGGAASIASFQLPYSVDHEAEQSYVGGHKQFLPLSIRNMAPTTNRGNATTALQLDALEFSREPLPFQRQHFKSSTILKMVQVPKRHQGMFVDVPAFSLSSLRKKAIMLHSYRYQWDELLPEMRTLQLMSAALFGHPVRMAQRERLGVDLDEALRNSKRERELLPHRREPRDLLLIGVQQLPYGDTLEPVHDMSAAAVRGIVLPRSSRPVPRNRPPATTVARISPAVSLPTAGNRPLGPADTHRVTASTNPQTNRHGAGSGGTAARAAARRPRRQGSASKDALPSGISSVALRLPKIGSSRVITLVSAGPSLQSEVPRPLSSDLSTASPSQESAQDADSPEHVVNGESDDAYKVDERLQSVELSTDQLTDNLDSEQLNDESDQQLPERERTLAEFSLARQGTPHPLRGADISQYGVDHAELTKLFTRLDTDADGHLTYPQVRPHLAMGLSAPQEKFVKLVYDIISASTFFGVQEFVQLTCLCDEIRSHGAGLAETYKTLDFSVAKEIIMRSVELFDSEVDRSASSHISIVALEDIVSIISDKEKDDAFETAFGRMASQLKLDTEFSKLNKIGFIALIPQFLKIDMFYDSVE